MLQIVLGILIALVAVGAAGFAFWTALKRGYQDYVECNADGVITNEEKLKLADDLIQAIIEARNVWEFLKKFLAAIKQLKRK